MSSIVSFLLVALACHLGLLKSYVSPSVLNGNHNHQRNMAVFLVNSQLILGSSFSTCRVEGLLFNGYTIILIM